MDLRCEFYGGYMYLGFSSICLFGVVVRLIFVKHPEVPLKYSRTNPRESPVKSTVIDRYHTIDGL